MADYIKPGRLRRTLEPITGTGAVFGLYSEPLGTIYDDDLTGAVMHRGKSGRGGGSHPTTLEVGLLGVHPSSANGHNARFFIRELQADKLGPFLGVSSASIMHRFAGRLGQSTVDDTGNDFHTTYGASSWIAQMNLSTRTTIPRGGQGIRSVLDDALDLTNPGRGLNVSYYGKFDTISTTQDAQGFKELKSLLGSDIGILFQETRDGRTRIMGHPYRADRVEAQLAATIPLTRSQALTPAKWEQRNEAPAIRIVYKITNPSGNVDTRAAEIAASPGHRETVDIDWSYMKIDHSGGQLAQEAYARVFETNIRKYQVPSVKVDLLKLISSPNQYHRDQAGHLLRLEAGDPIGFANDWPYHVRGVQFVEGITETIDCNQWTLDLSLVPQDQAVGRSDEPAIIGRTWDSAGGTWDQQTLKWDEA